MTTQTTEQPLAYLTGNHYPVVITDEYLGTYTETVTAPTHTDAVRSAAYIYQDADSLTVSSTPVTEPITFQEPEMPKPTPNTAGLIAARAVNAHPWLSAVYPEPEDTDLLITPPWPTNPADEATGHIEGRASWETHPSGTITYRIAIAYETPAGTEEDEVVFDAPGLDSMVWLDLARPIARLVGRLHAADHAPTA